MKRCEVSKAIVTKTSLKCASGLICSVLSIKPAGVNKPDRAQQQRLDNSNQQPDSYLQAGL
ncbi:MAG: hypothetical protein CVV11_12940 [Gammaproteobacteria bacterium HGW-Gammaproteobacteria-15]|nr:MAG: hypothetical protein CVV11_12940 [Gammaproteobacteria bacterium HGW-Gammaproteobacteria-15]